MGRGRPAGAGSVRIVGGEWRGRRLRVAAVPGLRPSGDRGRETLFNWLAGRLDGARCVDLFAGTGALGLEAASRGAGRVVLVERDRRAAAALRAAIDTLDAADRVALAEGDALAWLRAAAPGSLDLVFVDPPFDSGLAAAAWSLLCEGGLVRPGGFVYLEAPRSAPALPVPAGWAEWRSKALGDVRMRLLRREPGPAEAPQR